MFFGVVGVVYCWWFICCGVREWVLFWMFVIVEFVVMGIVSGVVVVFVCMLVLVDIFVLVLMILVEIFIEVLFLFEFIFVGWLSGNDVNFLWVVVVGFGVFFYLMGVCCLW